jgi:Diadenosine tetraphosphate (Ap4A) hydrolase and other HIT family hydrolases
MSKCPFCDPKKEEILFSNVYCYARYDGYPVSPGHILVIPFRHYEDYFESSSTELDAFREMVLQCKCFLDATHHPDGYNVGVNIGPAAGQSVFHVHIHVIPRYEGDMENPKGGVRGVIPAKRVY